MSIKCPGSIEELEELEEMLPLCRKELFEQAQARIKIGTAESLHEVSRQLGEELNRKPESIERSLRREQKTRGGTLSPLTQKFRISFTGENEWYTPLIYIEAARQVLGTIKLDPATSEFGQKRIQAIQYYTKDDDGLKYQWSGPMWLNPPYSQPLIAQFIKKTVHEYNASNITEAIILTHNYTDTEWFHELESIASLLCFTKGRIKYEKEDGTIAAPTQGACFFYLGENEAKFNSIFSQFGFIR